jgi:hypothetical protein
MPQKRGLDLGDFEVEPIILNDASGAVTLEALPVYNAETSASFLSDDVVLCSCCCC